MSYRITTLICWVCYAIAIFGVYMVKYVVADVQHSVQVTQADLHKEQESLHLLNAEWAYLNRPERLRKLAEAHLQLSPLDSRQIEEIKALPAAYEPEEDAPAGKASLFHPTADSGSN